VRAAPFRAAHFSAPDSNGGVQRRAAAQQFGIFDTEEVCAMRGTERDKGREFRRIWCRMIPCAEPGGRSAWQVRINQFKSPPRKAVVWATQLPLRNYRRGHPRMGCISRKELNRRPRVAEMAKVWHEIDAKPAPFDKPNPKVMRHPKTSHSVKCAPPAHPRPSHRAKGAPPAAKPGPSAIQDRRRAKDDPPTATFVLIEGHLAMP